MASVQSPIQDLTPHVAAIEAQLAVLDEALVSQDAGAVAACTQALHRSLADALAAFRHAGPDALTPQLRHQLLLAQARVTGQQSTVHRAASSIERTLSVLLPQEAVSTYSALASKSGPAVISAYSSR
jgi:alkylation response protein AidB-like acyl-CoA dehydrogenase